MSKELMETAVEQIGIVKARLADEENYDDLVKMLAIALRLIKLAGKESAA